MRTRRAGEPAAPTPIRARHAVDPSPRKQREPERFGRIRGLGEFEQQYRQTPETWREVWAAELAARSGRP